MSGKYRDDLIRSVLDTAATAPLGLRLARVCVEAELPAAYVAQVLGVSRMTIHTWFRGGNVHSSKVDKVIVFVQLVREDLKAGRLPVKTTQAAREYLQEMSDAPIRLMSPKKD